MKLSFPFSTNVAFVLAGKPILYLLVVMLGAKAMGVATLLLVGRAMVEGRFFIDVSRLQRKTYDCFRKYAASPVQVIVLFTFDPDGV